jgi:hypothetical protein
VDRFAADNKIPVVRFGKNDRKIEVMRPYLFGEVIRTQSMNRASSSLSRCQMMTRMERPTATIARCVPPRLAMRR